MSSCHHAVKKKGDMRSQRNSIYNIYIIYTISLNYFYPTSPPGSDGTRCHRHENQRKD